MRIVIFSDTHGNYAAMHKIIKRNGDADLFVFLGDGLSEFKKLKAHYIDCKMIAVKGNCDFDPDLPDHMVYELPNGKRMFLAHGDKWSVRTSVDAIYEKARELDCQFAFFGHTHVRYYEQRGNILILNPGSAGQPRDDKPACYAWLEITSTGIIYNHVNL
ncbi:MAG: metallophosphoesterase [Ruminococcus sp.]|nr:metallophosphoesterase [Ruminococcus sp.]MBQ1433975.1 metallophosphoesterase [Ruminococcus sp.]